MFIDFDEPIDRRICSDCGAGAPMTNTAHTLISREHGWRLQRVSGPGGQSQLRWHCAACWTRRKAHGRL